MFGLGGRRGAIAQNALTNAALKPFQLKPSEVQRILDTPWGLLNRRETQVRKLLAKFHDDPRLLQATVTRLVTNFDDNIAERTRAKMEDTRNAEEREWIRVDRVLNPGLWAAQPRQDPLLTQPTGGVVRGRALTEGLEAELTGADGGKSLLDQIKSAGGKATLASLVTAADAGDASVKFSLKKKWECPYNRDEILKIWSKRRSELKSDDEKKVQYLLKKYNGKYEEYRDWERSLQKKKRPCKQRLDHG